MHKKITVRSKLRDVWTRKIGDDSRSARIDVLDWLSKMTLDVIGQVGKSVAPIFRPKSDFETQDLIISSIA